MYCTHQICTKMRLLERLATESLISAQPNAHISVKHHSYQPSPSLLTTPTSSPIKIGRKWQKVDVAGSNWQKLAEWGFPNVVSLQMHTGSNSDAEISNNFINQLYENYRYDRGALQRNSLQSPLHPGAAGARPRGGEWLAIHRLPLLHHP